MISYIGSQFIVANYHSLTLSLTELSPQSNVVNNGFFIPKIAGEVYGEMVDIVESDHPSK